MPLNAPHLTAIEAFQASSVDELREMEQSLSVVPVARGQILLRQGDPADAIYIVISGRFRVDQAAGSGPIAEIGVGSPIGEIAFFAGGTRTATVTAERDSLVLELKREDFERLAERLPLIRTTITSQLARRLANMTATRKRDSTPRTIAICRAGGWRDAAEDVRQFATDLRGAFDPKLRVLALEEAEALAGLGEGTLLESSTATHWFNALEAQYDHVLYVADTELSEWSKKAVRQADMVLCVADANAASREPNLIEHFASSLHSAASLRLVLLHDQNPPYSGTRTWLDGRPWLSKHHHVLRGRSQDFARIARYLRGQAIGFVACGGGAYSAAHIGILEAVEEAGLVIDVLGGTSGGAAMAAAVALGVPYDEIERRTHEIFVTRKAMRRWTWPRYSLLDHTEFDRALSEHFTDADIADLALPFFAVATNLSRNTAVRLDRGPVWQAIRASAAIPALLPPVFTAEGEMLVDGCVSENVPINSMLDFKSGPNIVVDFHSPLSERYIVDSGSLPARAELMIRMLTPGRGQSLPDVPGPSAVLMRSLMLNRPDYEKDLSPSDILLAPSLPAGIGPLDWHRHKDLRAFARDFASTELARLRSQGHPVLAAR